MFQKYLNQKRHRNEPDWLKLTISIDVMNCCKLFKRKHHQS